MIIAAPDQKSKGQPSPRTVELLDIYPTLADLCGLTSPTNLAGRSLRPLLNDPQAKWDKPAFSPNWMQGRAGHSVRTERWRYTEWDDARQGMELYDYDKDPGEQHNLAHDPAHASIVAELRGLMKKNWEKAYSPPITPAQKKKTTASASGQK